MDFSDARYPLRRTCDFTDLSPSVHWAQAHKAVKNREYPLRRIYDFELLYVREGRITAHLNGTDYPLGAGDLLFIGAGIPHGMTAESDQVHLLGIHFDFFDELVIQYDQDIIVNEEAPRLSDFCREAVIAGSEPFSAYPVLVHTGETVKAMERLIDQFNLGLPGSAAYAKGLMLQILIGLYRSRAMHGRTPHNRNRETLTLVTDWIENHYRGDCSNRILAKLLNVHEDHMLKQFKSAYGVTPNKYLQLIRHREAKRLLRETDDTVERIGNQVGYEDIHYFSRIFRKWEGVSPRDYRNSSRIY